jgi:hypothetical protein
MFLHACLDPTPAGADFAAEGSDIGFAGTQYGSRTPRLRDPTVTESPVGICNRGFEELNSRLAAGRRWAYLPMRPQLVSRGSVGVDYAPTPPASIIDTRQ